MNYVRVCNVNNQPPNLPVTRRAYDTETTALKTDFQVYAAVKSHRAEAGIPGSTLSSKFCTVQVLEELKNLSLWNSEVSAFGSILKYCI